MCGRYAQSEDEAALVERFGLSACDRPPRPTWNACPTQELPVILEQAGSRVLRHCRWGFQPDWSRRPLINARSEEAATRKSFRAESGVGRCLVPATAFYEWQGMAGRRRPLRFRIRNQLLFACAGLHAVFTLEGRPQHCFTILTTAANAVVASIHDRMPAILDLAQEAAWLRPERLHPDQLEPLAGSDLEASPVDPALNQIGLDGPQLWDPPSQTSLF